MMRLSDQSCANQLCLFLTVVSCSISLKATNWLENCQKAVSCQLVNPMRRVLRIVLTVGNELDLTPINEYVLTEESLKDDGNDEPEELDDSYFTETLAKIYIKQHRYGKALEIIRKLNLKYPKKSIYFADQIRFLEKLVINEKTKQ